MPRVLLSMLVVALLGFMLTGCQAERPNPVVTIEMAAGGTIKIELDPDAAPNTVNNFIKLVQDGFYNGQVFHRIIPDFMIQGGCPEGDGTGGPGHTIMGEFLANGVRNPLKHERGVISMARGQLFDSAGSQFFIMHRNRPNLDGNYAAFGRVISGMEIVDRIVGGPSDQAKDGLALEPREVMQRVTVDTFGVQYEAPVVIERRAATGAAAQRAKPVVTMEMAAGGTIKIELDPDAAPNTVNNFIKLVQDGFYNGLVFHRIIPGFMIQGGCPEGKGTGDPGYAIRGEFEANGVRNPLLHERGVISMARSQHPDSAGSQFFIMHAAAPHLDRQYAAFGRVISGMEVVDRIVKGPASNDLALEPREIMQRVTVETFGVQYNAPATIRR